MVAFKNSTGIKANSSFCTFRFPIAEAHQLTKPFQYQAITTALPTQPFAHFVFMPIFVWQYHHHIQKDWLIQHSHLYLYRQILGFHPYAHKCPLGPMVAIL